MLLKVCRSLRQRDGRTAAASAFTALNPFALSSVLSENVYRPFYLAFLLLRMHWRVYSGSLGVTYERGLARVGVYVLYVSSHTGSQTPTDLLIKASQ